MNGDVVEVLSSDDRGPMVWFACPGCGENHGLPVGDGTRHPRWTFNGDKQKPTLTPSILARTGPWVSGPKQGQTEICHSYVRDGQIQFLGDCTHKLAGQTVPLPPIEVKS